MTITAHVACGTCHTRIIYATTPAGQWLPPVNWGPDPAGEMAVQQSELGTWFGRFVDRDEAIRFPEKRFRLHNCQETAALPGAGA